MLVERIKDLAKESEFKDGFHFAKNKKITKFIYSRKQYIITHTLRSMAKK